MALTVTKTESGSGAVVDCDGESLTLTAERARQLWTMLAVMFPEVKRARTRRVRT